MGIFDSIKDFLAPEVDEDEEEEVVVETKRVSAPKTSRTTTSVASNTQVVLFEPTSFDEAEAIARHLKERKACVVNLNRLQRDYAQRTIDFLTGSVFALDGSIQKVAVNTLLLTPRTIGVDGEINLDNRGE